MLFEPLSPPGYGCPWLDRSKAVEVDSAKVLERHVHLEASDSAADRKLDLERGVRLLTEGIRELCQDTAPDYRSLLSILAQQIEGLIAGTPVDSLLAHLTSELHREELEREKSQRRLSALAEVSREFSSSSGDLGQLLELVARRLGELLGDMCAIRATSDDGEWLEATGAVFHANPAMLAATRELMQSGRQRIGDGVSGGVARTGRAVLVARIDADYAAGTGPQYMRFLEQLGASSAITLPLQYRGKVVGVANLLRSSGSPAYDERDLAFAESLADHAAVAIANARATSAVRKAEARFARLSESGVIGIVVSDIDGHIAEINDTLLALLGHSRADILSGKVPWRDLTPPEWRDVDQRAIALLLESGVGGQREKEFIRKDGTRVSVMINSAMLEGESRECISYVLDLTSRKEAEAAVAQLREQRAADLRFRALLESAPDAMVIANEAGAIVLVNRQAESLFGFSRDELVGQPVEMLLPERLREALPSRRADYFRELGVRSMNGDLELQGQRKDGSEFAIEVSSSPLQTEGGLLVSNAIRDITERKKAEQQRASLAAIVSASADAIIGKTTTGEITSWNHGAARIFGYQAQEVIGKSISLIIPPGEEPQEAAILQAVGRGEVLRFDAKRLRKDGSYIDVSVTVSPVRDAAGRVIGIAKVARDITERRQAEAALLCAKDAAESASRELEAFSYSVAHDLRAPLRGMNGFAQILLEDYGDKLDEEGTDCLHEIHSNAKKMGELIDALLSLSRTTRTELRPELVNLSELVRNIAAELAATAPEREVSLVVQEPLQVSMDPALTRVLFDNLLGNAWKFTAHVAHARIEIGTVSKDGMLAVFVRDNGAGFDMAHAHKLFAPFQRLHTVAEFPGTGIGLATVQRIAHRHGGRIWAEGQVGAGAAFYLALPASCWGTT
ncbi:MAG: hypothetical protein JWN04_4460 [Myxococcaceae bacterium]|nr:hypothetical protein [Myxococcaceae bacterium]